MINVFRRRGRTGSVGNKLKIELVSLWLFSEKSVPCNV
jgi:hypothetical protein